MPYFATTGNTAVFLVYLANLISYSNSFKHSEEDTLLSISHSCSTNRFAIFSMWTISGYYKRADRERYYAWSLFGAISNNRRGWTILCVLYLSHYFVYLYFDGRSALQSIIPREVYSTDWKDYVGRQANCDQCFRGTGLLIFWLR